tara:strand:+ start:1658 stop:1978 length:321 start_codon:yes stop_codon:yes gene_type:complete
MSDERLLDRIDGISTFHRLDELTGKTIIRTSQDVEPLLNSNQSKFNEAERGWKGDMHHVASIPKVVYDAWWKEFGGDPMASENKARTLAKLNNSDWAKLRTKEGRI